MKRAVLAVLAVLGLGIGLLGLQGRLGGSKTAPGTVPLPTTADAGAGGSPAAGAGASAVVEVLAEELVEYQSFPGTVRPKTSASIAPKVMGRIVEMRARAGQSVAAREVLAMLDERDLSARADQARSMAEALRSERGVAETDRDRVKALVAAGAATNQELEAAQARAETLIARTRAAEDAYREAKLLLDEATIYAPFAGTIAERLAEPGDLAVPGRPLYVLYDPSRLRLETQVPESCAQAAALGAKVQVEVESLPQALSAVVDEVSPVADPTSRTFLVKADLPVSAELRPGMFGRFLQACGKRTVLLVPAAAVARVGQLESVTVVPPDGPPVVRHVTTGKAHGERIEVLTGLRAGEKVVVPVKP